MLKFPFGVGAYETTDLYYNRVQKKFSEDSKALGDYLAGDPLLSRFLDYLTQYFERMGTGIRDMITCCQKTGLPEPEFKLADDFVTIVRRSTGQVDLVRRLLISVGDNSYVFL